jgi:hypothetical protein
MRLLTLLAGFMAAAAQAPDSFVCQTARTDKYCRP